MEAEHSNAASGTSLAAEGDEFTCPRAHDVVCDCVGRDDVVAETDSPVALRVELEPGELLVGADLVDGGGIGLQVYRVHAEHNTPYDEGVSHDKR